MRSKFAIAAALSCLLVAPLAVDEARQRVDSVTSDDGRNASLVREPHGIYVSDPNDAWNQVFFLLFTRTVEARVAAADSPVLFSGDPQVNIGQARVSRVENGDRAIDPLYPSWLGMDSAAFDFDDQASWKVLREPRYSRLVAALEGVRLTARSRPPMARALMQADLWAAFDMVYALTTPRPGHVSDDVQERIQYAQLLLPRIAMAMRGLALTLSEIAALPNTYLASATTLNLPNLLGQGTAWREIRWLRDRSHDRASTYRRATRVFVELKEPPADEAAFLNGLREDDGRAPKAIASVALLTQLLLVASDGSVTPSSITYDVQLRGDAARQGGSIVPQYELSRHLLLVSPAGGGLVAFDANAPAYLPSAGNDLGFATPPRLDGEPIEAPLERRCAACHGAGLEVGRLMTFSQNIGPQSAPPVERLPIEDNGHGHDVARRKMEREDYRALLARW